MSAKPYDVRTLRMVQRVLRNRRGILSENYGESRVIEDQEYLHAALEALEDVRVEVRWIAAKARGVKP